MRLLRGAETSQRWLLHWSLPLHGWGLMRAGNLELTAQPVGSSTCGRVSLANISFSLSFFWEVQLVSASSRQLEWPLFLSSCLAGLRLIQAAWLVWEFSRQLRVTLCSLLFFHMLRGWGASAASWFQGLLVTILNCLFLSLRNLPEWWSVTLPLRTVCFPLFLVNILHFHELFFQDRQFYLRKLLSMTSRDNHQCWSVPSAYWVEFHFNSVHRVCME